MSDMNDVEERAISFVMSVLSSATDWQEAQHALANHHEFGPWLEANDPLSPEPAQRIIRQAENRLGDDLPY